MNLSSPTARNAAPAPALRGGPALRPRRAGASWERVGAILAPAGCSRVKLDGSPEDLLRELEWEGVVPLAAEALESDPQRASLVPSLPAMLAREVARHKVRAAVILGELDRVLALLERESLRPVLLKGADLANRYYRSPHLRPMSDIDLLFPGQEEAWTAFRTLGANGYADLQEGGPAVRWGWEHHLPALASAANGILVEVHGSLIYAPSDGRASRVLPLCEQLAEWEWNGHRCLGLAPEANVVYLLAHMYTQHEADPPRFIAIADVAAVLRREGERFRWPILEALSEETGFAGDVWEGLAAARLFLGADVPPATLQRLSPRADRSPARLSREGSSTQQTLAGLWHTGGARGRWLLFKDIVFPPVRYLRTRYPQLARLPVWAAYPYRWADQARKVILLALERTSVRKKRRRRPDKGGKPRVATEN